MAYSVNLYMGNGATTTYAVNFTLGYLAKSHVECYVEGEVDGLGDPILRTLTWITDNLINIGTAPANGLGVTVRRNTPKDTLMHDYQNGAVMQEQSFDESNLQHIMIAHEILDGYSIERSFDMDMCTFKIINLGTPTLGTDAATKAYVDTTLPAAVAATAADVVLTHADVISAEADKVQTGLDRIATAADKVATNADVLLAEADKVQTGLDRIATASDRVQTGLDATSAASDRVQTGLDATSAASDRVQTGLDATSAASSASSATNAYDSFDDRYLGAKTVAPTLDNDGAALLVGALYFNSTSNTMFVYGSDSTWGATTLTDGSVSQAKMGFNVFRKNVIINGSFRFWQRAVTQTSSGVGSDDRWFNVNVGSTKVASRQTFTLGQVIVPGNPTFYSRTVVTSVVGSTYLCVKTYKVEKVSTFAGETCTLSFWAKADAVKNIAVEFSQYFGVDGAPSTTVYITPTTVALTTEFVRCSVTVALPSITGKTLGTIGDYLQITLWFEAGSSFNSRTNSLGQQSGTFDIANVQLESGSIATDFEQLDYATEYSMCQRYYFSSNPISYFPLSRFMISAGNGYGIYNLPVTMRTTPTVTFPGPWTVASGFTTPILFSGTSTQLTLDSNVAMTAGDIMYANAGYLTADAEL